VELLDRPKWTVLYNIVSPESDRWIGTGYEFFDEEETAAKAYVTYAKLYGDDQSLKRLAERGGFGPEEFASLVRGLRPSRVLTDYQACANCAGSGEVVDHEEGGIVFKCGICYGAGVLCLPAGV